MDPWKVLWRVKELMELLYYEHTGKRVDSMTELKARSVGHETHFVAWQSVMDQSDNALYHGLAALALEANEIREENKLGGDYPKEIAATSR
jgi:hypothetical protein